MVDLEKVGKAITFLRKRVGYTQKDLADRIGVSDKAVSKWERGLGLPDISYLSKLAILLDSDIDSILNGDIVYHKECWNGLLVFKSSDIKASTVIYDKPLSSYLLSYFLLVGIKTIHIQCEEDDKIFFLQEYGNGSKLGVELIFDSINKEIEFEDKCTNVMVVFGKSFIYGVDQTRFFQRAMQDKNNICVLSLPKELEEKSIAFNENKKISKIDAINTEYNYYHIPIGFMPKSKVDVFILEPSSENNNLYTEPLDRGFVEITINNYNDVLEASQFVRTVQKYCGMHIYCVEEIAWRRGLISLEQLKSLAEEHCNEYGAYLLKIYNNQSDA